MIRQENPEFKFLGQILERGITVRLDEVTIRELLSHWLTLKAERGEGFPDPDLPELARHCIRGWISRFPMPKSADKQELTELPAAAQEYLGELLEKGVTIRLDESTIRELFHYRIRVKEIEGGDFPVPELPALARHCIRKWVSYYTTQQSAEGVANE